MTTAILSPCFDRNARMIVTALSQFGPAMTDELITPIAESHGKQRDVDYVFLGYKPYPAITILAMGTNYRVPFPTDYYGTTLDRIPMMKDIRNFGDVKTWIFLQLAGTVHAIPGGMTGVNSVLVLVGIMCSLVHFFLPKPHTGGLGVMSKTGIYTLLLASGRDSVPRSWVAGSNPPCRFRGVGAT